MNLPTYVRSLAAKLEVSGRVVATRCCFGKFTSARHILRHKWAAVLSVSGVTEKNEKNEKKNDDDDDDCLFHITIDDSDRCNHNVTRLSRHLREPHPP